MNLIVTKELSNLNHFFRFKKAFLLTSFRTIITQTLSTYALSAFDNNNVITPFLRLSQFVEIAGVQLFILSICAKMPRGGGRTRRLKSLLELILPFS